MSFRAVVWVMDHSESKLGARLVMLAIAEYAHDDGTKAWPSVATIAAKTRLSERAVQYALRQLVRDNEIRQTGQSRTGTKVWEIVGMRPNVRGANSASPSGAPAGGANSAARGADSAPDPVKNQNPSGSPSANPTGSLKKTTSSSSSTQRDARERAREDVDRLCHLLADLMVANDSKARVSPESRGWRDPIRLLLDRDGRVEAEVEAVIRWSQDDDFERTNVLSPAKLRKRFGELLLKSQRAAAARPRPGTSDGRGQPADLAERLRALAASERSGGRAGA